jgi:hypothetical protein
MKAQLTIELPDGWELAEPEVRCAHKGESYWDWHSHGVETWSLGDPTVGRYPILRRTRSEYVNVKMLRTDAEWAGVNSHDAFAPPAWLGRMRDACREALAAADKEV